MNQCKSAEGRRLIKSWILNPLKEKNLIEDRLNSVGTLLRLNSERGILPELQTHLRGVPRISVIILARFDIYQLACPQRAL